MERIHNEAKFFNDHSYEILEAYTMPVNLPIWQWKMWWVYKKGVEYICSPRDVKVCELHLSNSIEWW